MLYILSWLLVMVVVVGFLSAFLFQYRDTAVVLTSMIPVFLLCMWLTKNGYIDLATVTLLVTLLFVNICFALVGRFVFHYTLLVFPIVITIASLMLPDRLFLWVAGVCICLVSFLVWAEFNGWILADVVNDPLPQIPVSFDMIIVVVIMASNAFLVRVVGNSLRYNLKLTIQNEQALAIKNEELAWQAEEIRKQQKEARSFQDALHVVHELGLELSLIKSLPVLYKQVVDRGRLELGFDRLAVLLYDEESGEMVGTYGTDVNGRVVDESSFRTIPQRQDLLDMLMQRAPMIFSDDIELNFAGKMVGRGWNAIVGLWDGDKGIGWLSADNLLTQEPPQPFQLEILALYATTVGHLITRLRTAAALQTSEAEAREFQEKLQILHEVNIYLSQLRTLDELYYQAIYLGLTRLGFERLGLLLYDKEAHEIVGTFGTDEYGQIYDAHHVRVGLNERGKEWYELIRQNKRLSVFYDADIYTRGKLVGRGWRATSLLWDGKRGIGWLATDHLLSGSMPQSYHLELLFLYGAALGNLISRKRTEELLKGSELAARQLQEKLQILHEVTIELAGSETLDQLYRQAVELGRERLGFERLGLLLYDKDQNMMVGTYGTDQYGRLRDERDFRQKIDNPEIIDILQNKQRVGFWEEAPIRDGHEIIGQGWNAMSVLWNGDQGIGWLAADNFIENDPISPIQLELLTLYGRMLGHLVTLKKNETEIQAYAIELERSNQELQQFAYVSSHDLQEPLRKIQTFGDRLQQQYASQMDERGVDYLRRMQDAASRMQSLIHDLLAFSRVNTQQRLFMPIDLAEVVNEVLSVLETRIEETNSVIEVDKLPIIDADATQMRQLFQNLLSNAIKFRHPDQSPVIQVNCQPEVNGIEGGKHCLIYVRDNGIGFDEKYSERIFGVFQRLHGRSEYEGTGVGLAICRRIVERHNGRIVATSTPGQGSTFAITLPLKHKSPHPPL